MLLATQLGRYRRRRTLGHPLLATEGTGTPSAHRPPTGHLRPTGQVAPAATYTPTPTLPGLRTGRGQKQASPTPSYWPPTGHPRPSPTSPTFGSGGNRTGRGAFRVQRADGHRRPCAPAPLRGPPKPSYPTDWRATHWPPNFPTTHLYRIGVGKSVNLSLTATYEGDLPHYLPHSPHSAFEWGSS